MKVLLLSTSLEGGAGGSAYKLHRGLQNIGVESQILVQTKNVDDEAVIIAPRKKVVRLLRGVAREAGLGKLDNLPLKLYPHREQTCFSLGWLPDSISCKVAQLNPDVINLRWIGNLVRIETLPKLKKPLVWTLSDMWPFTGGCYIPQDCTRYNCSCGACPQLNSKSTRDLSRWVWQRKARAWRGLDLTIVTPSLWLARCARSSSLFKDLRIEVISTGVDINKYKPVNRRVAREMLGLPQNRQLVLFGAWYNLPHKGFNLLLSALQNLENSGWHNKIDLVVFGFSHANYPLGSGVRCHYLGKLRDQVSLALAYAASDVFAAPSILDNFPNTVLEASACGTPCVAFNIGGMPELIDHLRNGYLAKPFEVEDLAKGIAWVLRDKDRHKWLSSTAREKVEKEFTLEQNARRYQALFSEVVENRNASPNGHRVT